MLALRGLRCYLPGEEGGLSGNRPLFLDEG